MITTNSTSKEWIERTAKSVKADKILVEKVVWALIFLEGLAESELEYIFKGGTANMCGQGGYFINNTKKSSEPLLFSTSNRVKVPCTR